MAELSEARRVAASTVTEDETAVETPAENPVEAAVADEEETASEETSEETNPNPEEEQAVTASTVQRLADERPPAPTRSVVTITAAADVPHFATGSVLDGLDGVAQALVNRSKGFPRQFGIEGAQMQRYGVASLGLSFPDHLIADNKDDMAVVASAAKETSLDGGSLVAAGGWCAPSETLYDFCQDESTDGLLDLPEIAVAQRTRTMTSQRTLREPIAARARLLAAQPTPRSSLTAPLHPLPLRPRSRSASRRDLPCVASSACLQAREWTSATDTSRHCLPRRRARLLRKRPRRPRVRAVSHEGHVASWGAASKFRCRSPSSTPISCCVSAA